MATENQNIPESANAKIVKYVAIGILLLIGKNMYAKKQEEKADDAINSDPAAGQARALDAALHPTGWHWAFTGGTDTDAIFAIAPQITNYEDVQKFYRAQTGKELDGEINTALKDQYARFIALVTQGKKGDTKYAAVLQAVPANLWVVTKFNANIRTTAKMPGTFENSNTVKTISAGKSIGVTTGKYTYDTKNDIVFVEFWTLGLDDVKHFFYVAKSQIEMLTKAQKAERESMSKLPYEFLAGLSGATDVHTLQTISTHPTTIYSEDFNAVSTIPKNIIIGFPLLTLDTGKGNYIKVQTVQGLIRWVKSEDTTTQKRI